MQIVQKHSSHLHLENGRDGKWRAEQCGRSAMPTGCPQINPFQFQTMSKAFCISFQCFFSFSFIFYCFRALRANYVNNDDDDDPPGGTTDTFKDHCNKTVDIYEDVASPEVTNQNRGRPMTCVYRFRSFRGAPRDWVLRLRFKKFKVGTIVNATHCDGGFLQVCTRRWPLTSLQQTCTHRFLFSDRRRECQNWRVESSRARHVLWRSWTTSNVHQRNELRENRFLRGKLHGSGNRQKFILWIAGRSTGLDCDD